MKTLAVFKLSSCDGCQLTLLNCEHELLALAGRIRIAHFLEASRNVEPGPYDLALVEGSVSTPEEAERVLTIRRESRYLVAIGACATAGGIQALRNFARVEEWKRLVYPNPEYVSTLEHVRPVSEYVPVDFELRGCPVDRGALLEVILAFLHGRRPAVPGHSVCVECKRAGYACLPVSRGTLCLGPITQAGCGALCPGYGRGCYGCFGAVAGAPVGTLVSLLKQTGHSGEQVTRALRTYTTGAQELRSYADAHDQG